MNMNPDMIAPCGMNCSLCIGHLRQKNQCAGCLAAEGRKQGHCEKCSIKLCPQHDSAAFTYCHECVKFPCARLKRLYLRYQENYGVSLMDNLLHIRDNGMEQFLESESGKWACAGCGATLSVHRDKCLVCGKAYR